MSNPRNINQVLQSSRATSAAKLPSVPSVKNPTDRTVVEAINALKERSEVREGNRGNPWEAVITARQMEELGLVRTGNAKGHPSDLAGIVGQTKAGEFVLVSLYDLAKAVAEQTAKNDGSNLAGGM